MMRLALTLTLICLLLVTSFAAAEAAESDRAGKKGDQRAMPAANASGIEGQVSIGPVRSVEQSGVANQRPYAARITVIDQAGHEVASIDADAEGKFQIALPPGTYLLRPERTGPYPRAAEQRVKVGRDRMTRVTIVYDSGKR